MATKTNTMTYPHLSKRPAVTIYEGEDYVRTVMNSNAGQNTNCYCVVTENAHGDTDMSVFVESAMIEIFGHETLQKIKELLCS